MIEFHDLAGRVARLAAFAQWCSAVTEAQRECRAYSWLQGYRGQA